MANFPSTVVNTALGNGVTWTDVTNVTAADGSFATATCPDLLHASDWINCQNFGFTLPIGATIDGIEVAVKRKANNIGAQDYIVQLLKNGTATGTQKLGNSMLDTLTEKVYGSSSDLWGTTWTASDINNSGFGVQYSANAMNNYSSTIYVDSISITIYITYVSVSITDTILSSENNSEICTLTISEDGSILEEFFPGIFATLQAQPDTVVIIETYPEINAQIPISESPDVFESLNETRRHNIGKLIIRRSLG